MFNPTMADAPARLSQALDTGALPVVALFPAMHHYALDDRRVEQVFEEVGSRGGAVFVHCGVLSVGVRRKLGLPSPFDLRLGDPIALARTAARYPHVPVIIPHFGAGLFREALMAADQCANIHLDTSSSNGWMRYHPRLTLADVFRSALDVAGPERVLFGTDSSFFPRGWQAGIRDAQLQALSAAGATDDQIGQIMSGNFDRLFRRELTRGPQTAGRRPETYFEAANVETVTALYLGVRPRRHGTRVRPHPRGTSAACQRAGRHGPAERQGRDRRDRAARSAGDCDRRRQDRRDRQHRRHQTPRWSEHAGHRPERTARDPRVHRGAWPLHGRGSGAVEPELDEHPVVGRDRQDGG